MSNRSAADDGELVLPPWIEEQRAVISSMLDRGQAPQALLIHGAHGTGRRHLAFWYAARLLGVRGGRFAALTELVPGGEEECELAHPDVLLVQPPAEKDSIPIETIRGLIEFLHLKSHQGGARVVVVWPAEAMTRSSANSLLKTLEEPPGGSTIVLVASTPASLPPTVVSRCQRLRVKTPTAVAGRKWLEQECGPGPWDLLLEFAGGAPLRARALHRAGFASRAQGYAEDLHKLRNRSDGLVTVARRWADSKADAEVLLSWLYAQAARDVVEASIAQVSGSRAISGDDRLQNTTKPLNIRRRLERLRLVEEMYRNRSRSMNAELQFTALLQRWYGEAASGG